MTKEEIIEMAKQSGAMFDHMTWLERDLLPVFERFAKLVAEKERQEILEITDYYEWVPQISAKIRLRTNNE